MPAIPSLRGRGDVCKKTAQCVGQNILLQHLSLPLLMLSGDFQVRKLGGKLLKSSIFALLGEGTEKGGNKTLNKKKKCMKRRSCHAFI